MNAGLLLCIRLDLPRVGRSVPAAFGASEWAYEKVTRCHRDDNRAPSKLSPV
jgi:hypothetical protein